MFTSGHNHVPWAVALCCSLLPAGYPERSSLGTLASGKFPDRFFYQRWPQMVTLPHGHSLPRDRDQNLNRIYSSLPSSFSDISRWSTECKPPKNDASKTCCLKEPSTLLCSSSECFYCKVSHHCSGGLLFPWPSRQTNVSVLSHAVQWEDATCPIAMLPVRDW